MNRYLILLTIIILLGGCTKPVTSPEVEKEVPNSNEEIVEDKLSTEEQQEVLKAYYNLLKIKGNEDGIKSFLEKNIDKLDQKIVDAVIISLEDYLMASDYSIDELSTILMKFYDKASGEIQYYLDIINREVQMPFTDGEGIKIELNELLDRLVQAEEYLRNFPESSRKDKIFDYYQAYIIGSITGAGNQYIYAEDGSSTIKQAIINQYNKIIDNYQDFSSAKILKQYIDTLAMDNNDLNGESTLKFYEDIEMIIKDNSNF